MGIREGNLPFYLGRSGSGGPAVLLIHGLGASPYETRPLGEYLHRIGFTVYGIRLPGHGTSPAELRVTTLAQWASAVKDSYDLLSKGHARVYVVGVSLGGLLALEIATERPVAAVVTVAPALVLRNRLTPLTPFVKFFYRYSVREVAPEERPYYYRERPLAAVHELMRLSSLVKEQSRRVVVPLLILQSRADPTVAPKGAAWLLGHVGSAEKRLSWYDAPAHVLIRERNPEWMRTHEEIGRFLTEQEALHAGKKLQ